MALLLLCFLIQRIRHLCRENRGIIFLRKCGKRIPAYGVLSQMTPDLIFSPVFSNLPFSYSCSVTCLSSVNSLIRFLHRLDSVFRVRVGAVRFPMGSLVLFNDLVLSASLWPWVRLSPEQKWIPRAFPGGKDGRCVGLKILQPSCAYCLVIVGATVS